MSAFFLCISGIGAATEEDIKTTFPTFENQNPNKEITILFHKSANVYNSKKSTVKYTTRTRLGKSPGPLGCVFGVTHKSAVFFKEGKMEAIRSDNELLFFQMTYRLALVIRFAPLSAAEDDGGAVAVGGAGRKADADADAAAVVGAGD